MQTSTKKFKLTAATLAMAALAACGGAGTANYNPMGTPVTETSTPLKTRTFERVFIVVMENENAADVLNNGYYRSLAKRGAIFSKARGVAHPSYPNYLAMVGGDTFGVKDSTQRTLSDAALSDLLEARELTWKNYAEDYPGGCFLGGKFGNNARKHVPFLSFATVQQDPTQCANVVNAVELENDLAAGKLPHVMLYSPNLDHDGHDSGLKGGANWLEGFLEPLLHDARFMAGTLVVVTFDESGGRNDSNAIYTVFVGDMVKPGVVSAQPLSHYGLLRTIEDNFELGTLDKQDEKAAAVTDVWM